MDQLIPQLDYTQPEYESKLASCLNWLGDKLDSSQLKYEFLKYCKTIDREEDAILVPATKLVSVGKIAYLLNRGARLEDRTVSKILDLLESIQITNKGATSFNDVEETARSKFLFSYVSCYSLIDNTWWQLLKKKSDYTSLADDTRAVIRKYSNGKTAILSQLKNHYLGILEDAKEDKALKSWIKPLSMICDTIELMAVTSRGRSKVKKKTSGMVDKKAEKAATNLTYKAEDNELGIKSLQPNAVIGAKAVVLYNTKNKHCELYLAETDKTISLKGSYLLNWDTAISYRKTLRKPQSELINWSQAGNLRRLQVLLDNTSGQSKPVKGKFNQNIVIIKAIH
jgi:hypothetical protein